MRILLIFVYSAICVGFAAAQETGTRKQPLSNRGDNPPAAASTAEQQRFAAVLAVGSIAARLREVSDTKVKARALAELGDLLWKDDEPYARELFLLAYDLTKKTDQTSSAEARKLAALRKQILGPIAHRDPNLVKKLIEDQKSELTDAQRAETNLSIAYQLLDSYEDAEGAEGFARSSLNQGMRVGQLTVWLLELREKSPRNADLLFRDLVQTLLTQSTVQADDLLYLGTYLFTSPHGLSYGPTTRSVTIIGGVPVPDITADRPNMPVGLVRDYLAAATSILLRETTDGREQKLRYVATYMLTPKAERVAPELLPALWKARQMLAGQVPAAFTQPQTYANLNRPSFDDQTGIDRALEEIARLPDQSRRDVRYVSLVFMLWSKGHFIRAREVTNKISDLNAQRELNCVIDFADAVTQLEAKNGDFGAVENMAKKQQCNLERAMLWLAIANVRNKAGNKQSTREALANGLTAARSMDDAHVPYLLLSVAGHYASLDAHLAQVILREAVKEFNQQTPEKLGAVNWTREITVGPLKQPFALKVNGVSFDFEKNVQALVDSDAESTMATIKTLTSEPALAAGLLGVAKTLLK